MSRFQPAISPPALLLVLQLLGMSGCGADAPAETLRSDGTLHPDRWLADLSDAGADRPRDSRADRISAADKGAPPTTGSVTPAPGQKWYVGASAALKPTAKDNFLGLGMLEFQATVHGKDPPDASGWGWVTYDGWLWTQQAGFWRKENGHTTFGTDDVASPHLGMVACPGVNVVSKDSGGQVIARPAVSRSAPSARFPQSFPQWWDYLSISNRFQGSPNDRRGGHFQTVQEKGGRFVDIHWKTRNGASFSEKERWKVTLIEYRTDGITPNLVKLELVSASYPATHGILAGSSADFSQRVSPGTAVKNTQLHHAEVHIRSPEGGKGTMLSDTWGKPSPLGWWSGWGPCSTAKLVFSRRTSSSGNNYWFWQVAGDRRDALHEWSPDHWNQTDSPRNGDGWYIKGREDGGPHNHSLLQVIDSQGSFRGHIGVEASENQHKQIFCRLDF